MKYFLPIPYEDTTRTTLGKQIGKISFEYTLGERGEDLNPLKLE
jgi:hypothetical protein